MLETLDIMSEHAVGGGHVGGPVRLVSLIYCIPVQLGGPTTRHFSNVLKGYSRVIEVSLVPGGMCFWKAPRACAS